MVPQAQLKQWASTYLLVSVLSPRFFEGLFSVCFFGLEFGVFAGCVFSRFLPFFPVFSRCSPLNSVDCRFKRQQLKASLGG